jgi:prevent-host-death family protein
VKKITLANATASLAQHVEGLDRQPLVVTVRGKPVAALVPLDGLDWEALSLGTNPDFLDLIEQSRRLHAGHARESNAEPRPELKVAPTAKGPKLKPNGRRGNGAKSGRQA